jgi:hypothetical protein
MVTSWRDINESAWESTKLYHTFFILAVAMTRARNFRAFGDGGFHEGGGFRSRRSVASLAGFSGPVNKNSLPVNQNGGRII